MDPNWDNLRYFNALVECCTLSEAARKMGVSHSTVQRHIDSLENELNVQLFNQGASGYKLTEAGRRLHYSTSEIEKNLRLVSSQIANSDEQLSARVTVSVTETIGHFLMPDITRKIHHVYPGIKLNLSFVSRMTNIEDLEADIGIRACLSPPTNLIGRSIAPITYSACASREYLKRNDLTVNNALATAANAILLDQSYSGSIFSDWAPVSVKEVNVTRINSLLGAYQLCRAGVGVALLPEYILALCDELVALDCSNLPASNDLWVLSHASLRNSSSVKAVRTVLYEELQRSFDT